MPFQFNEHSISIKTVNLTGRVDALQAQELRPAITQLIDDGAHDLVIDLSQVEFIDSAGLAVLVAALKHARKYNGDVRLVKPQAEAAQRILTLTKFDQVFKMFDAIEAAVQSFKG